MSTRDLFRIFQDHHQQWLKVLGLNGWRAYYEVSTNVDFYAQTQPDLLNMNCIVRVNVKNLAEKDIEHTKSVALHEALHLTLPPLWKLAKSRFASEDHIDCAEEEIVRRLESVITNLHA